MDEGEQDSKARIRGAALEQFATLGFKGATVRGIAEAAGVSPGMVQHHFPSKQALRDECDAYVFSYLRNVRQRGILGGELSDSGFVSDMTDTIQVLGRYVATALLGDSETAAAWFDELAEMYREFLTSGDTGPGLPEGEDDEAIIAVYTAMELGLTLLTGHVYRRLGTDEPNPVTMARIGRARLFLATNRTIDEDLANRLRKSFDNHVDEYEGSQ